MKAVILAGGFGSRLAEETTSKPKPMVEIGGRPILWHIMNIFAAHGVDEFVIALGYRAEVVKQYFLNYYAVNSDMTIDLSGCSAERKAAINSRTFAGARVAYKALTGPLEQMQADPRSASATIIFGS